MGSSFCFKVVVLIGLRVSLWAADPIEATFKKAAAALAAQDYAGAERGFQSVLRTQPGNIGALGNLGVVYSRTRRYARAIDTYKRALRVAPGEKGLLTNLGLAYLKQEDFAQALPIFEQLSMDPSNEQARELVAMCRLSLGQLDGAVEVLEPLQAANPKNTGALYMLGVALTKLKRTDEAHLAFARMMEAASPAQANLLMGRASYDTGRFEDAAAYFRKALAAEPRIEGGHRELGKTLISLRDNDAAEKELRQADTDDGEALYFLGALLAQSHKAEAVSVLTKARALTPDAWGPLYYLGRVYLEQANVKHALECLERAGKLKPDEPAVQYQLGVALRKVGREPEARAAFARVKELKAKTLKSEIDVLSPSR